MSQIDNQVEIITDFYSDWSAILRDELRAMGQDVSPREARERIPVKYFNLLKRRIPKTRRLVRVSREFTCPAAYQQGLNLLLRKARSGEDLTPHLSTRLLNADYNDALLNDWGIHHLHLGTVPDQRNPQFVARTDFLLFAQVTDDHFYAINVMGHGNWARQRLIGIIHNNWPQSIDSFRIEGILDFKDAVTDQGLRLLRDNQINTPVQTSDGTVYFGPGGGLALSGDSAQVVQRCKKAEWLLMFLERKVKKASTALADTLRSKGIQFDTPIRLRLTLQDREAVLVEDTTGVEIEIAPGIDFACVLKGD
ncbi:MAG: hypothetical protein ACLP5H_22885 [Desulfomonilaceae bacterium]